MLYPTVLSSDKMRQALTSSSASPDSRPGDGAQSIGSGLPASWGNRANDQQRKKPLHCLRTVFVSGSVGTCDSSSTGVAACESGAMMMSVIWLSTSVSPPAHVLSTSVVCDSSSTAAFLPFLAFGGGTGRPKSVVCRPFSSFLSFSFAFPFVAVRPVKTTL